MTSRILGLAISTCSGASETHDVWNSWIRSSKAISNNDDAVESCLIVLWCRGSPSHCIEAGINEKWKLSTGMNISWNSILTCDIVFCLQGPQHDYVCQVLSVPCFEDHICCHNCSVFSVRTTRRASWPLTRTIPGTTGHQTLREPCALSRKTPSSAQARGRLPTSLGTLSNAGWINSLYKCELIIPL